MSTAHNANRHQKEKERAAAKPDSPQNLKRQIHELEDELKAIRFAAHMPDDYKFGLPSWINQKLYASWVGMDFSPDVLSQIAEGKLTFADAPVWKERDELRARLAALESERRADANAYRVLTDPNGLHLHLLRTGILSKAMLLHLLGDDATTMGNKLEAAQKEADHWRGQHQLMQDARNTGIIIMQHNDKQIAALRSQLAEREAVVGALREAHAHLRASYLATREYYAHMDDCDVCDEEDENPSAPVCSEADTLWKKHLALHFKARSYLEINTSTTGADWLEAVVGAIKEAMGEEWSSFWGDGNIYQLFCRECKGSKLGFGHEAMCARGRTFAILNASTIGADWLEAVRKAREALTLYADSENWTKSITTKDEEDDGFISHQYSGDVHIWDGEAIDPVKPAANALAALDAAGLGVQE